MRKKSRRRSYGRRRVEYDEFCVRCKKLKHNEDKEKTMIWKKTNETLPPEEMVVDTMSENGLQQPLKRVRNLWFHPEGGMYVYYTPKFWKELD